MVIDYRMLNKKTIRDRYPLPRIDQLLDNTFGAQWYSKMDMIVGYYQVLMEEADVHKTAFTTPLGNFEYLVMPMGQANSSATFQRLVDKVFPYAEVYTYLQKLIDDLLLHTKTVEEQFVKLRSVLQVLRENKLYLKFSKCEFMKKEVIWLGHKLFAGKRAIDPEKVNDIRNFELPKSYKELMSFLGMVNFVRDYLPGLSAVSSVVSDLTKG